MQNPNTPNANNHLANRTHTHASLLDARSLSPNIHMMHNFHEANYPANVMAQQYYHSMPHVS